MLLLIADMDNFFGPGETNSTITNANENDDPGDQALIDLVPIPADNQSSEEPESLDPFAGIFG